MLSENDAALVLNAIAHWGPIRLARVRQHHACKLSEVFELSDAELFQTRDVGPRSIASLRSWKSAFDLEKEKSLLAKTNTQFVTQKNPSYPERLKQMSDPPIGLYWRGPKKATEAEVAIVGSRRTTPYGRRIAEEWSRALSKQGITVVSGLARGIDACAHRGALSGSGSTLAILGSALDRIYPAEHLELFRSIAELGAVVSEVPFGRPASKTSFPMRNRIVSGIAKLVLVVETDESGGSMITAKFAGEQGKTVGAVPSRVDSKQSSGCHQLIRDGAILMRSVEDILEELAWDRSRPDQLDMNLYSETKDTSNALSPEELRILSKLEGGEYASADALVDSLSMSFPQVASTLMMLELKNKIVKRADGTFESR